MQNNIIQLYKNAYGGINRLVWLQSFVLFVNRCGTMVVPFVALYCVFYFKVSIKEAGFVVVAFGLGSMLGSLLGGWATDKFGFYKIELTTLFLGGVFFISCAFAKTIFALSILLFFAGLIGDAFRPANVAALSAYSTKENYTRSFGVYRLAINLGFAIGPAVGGILATINYKLLFYVDGTTCILASILLYILLPNPSKNKTITLPKEKKNIAKKLIPYNDTTFLYFCFFTLLYIFCFLQFLGPLPLFMKNIMHINETKIGFIFGVNGLIIVAVEMFFLYFFEGKKAPLWFVSIGCFFCGIAYLIFNIQATVFMAWMCMLLYTISEIIAFSFMNKFWIERTNDNNRGTYAGFYSFTWGLAHILAPLIGTIIIEKYNFNVLWYVVFALCTIASFGFYKLSNNN